MSSVRLRRSGWFYGFLLALVVVGHGVLNLIHLRRDELPPTYDPAYHLLRTLDYADQLTGREPTGPLRILRTSHYYPPLSYWTAAPLQVLWGPSQDAAVGSLFIYLAVAMVATYGIGAHLFSPGVGLMAAVLLSLYPAVFGLSREFYPDVSLLAMVAVGFYTLLVSEGFRSRKGSILFGVATGLGMLSKWTYPVFLAGPVAYFVWQGLGRLELAAGFRQFWHSEKRNQAIGWYLISLVAGALALFLWLRATERSGRRISEHALMAVFFFHLFAGSMVCLALSGRLVVQYFPLIRRAVPDARVIRSNLLWAALIAAVIAGPWYLVNAREIVYRLIYAAVRDAEARAMPGLFSLRGLVEYPMFLEGHQLHLVFFVLFLVAVGYRLYRRSTAGGLLLGTIAVAYVLLCLIRLKNPRFSVPYLPFVAVLSASFLLCVFRSRVVTGCLVTGVLGWGVFQMVVISFGDRWMPEGWRLPEFKGWYFRPMEELTVFKKTGWGSDRSAEGDWQSGKILARLNDRWEGEKYPARVAVVGNRPYFHASGFEFLSRAGGLPFEFFPALEGSEAEFSGYLRRIVDADFIIADEGGDPGFVFGFNPYEEIVDSLHRGDGRLALNFRLMGTEFLPEGSAVRVYRREPGRAWKGKPALVFEHLAELESYQAWPVVLEPTGELQLEVTWRLHPALLGRYRFFMHIYDLGGEFQFALDDSFELSRGRVVPARPELQGPVRTNHTIPLQLAGEQGLGPGQYNLAVGVWRPDDGSRLQVKREGKELGDIVFLDVPVRVATMEAEGGGVPGPD